MTVGLVGGVEYSLPVRSEGTGSALCPSIAWGRLSSLPERSTSASGPLATLASGEDPEDLAAFMARRWSIDSFVAHWEGGASCMGAGVFATGLPGGLIAPRMLAMSRRSA